MEYLFERRWKDIEITCACHRPASSVGHGQNLYSTTRPSQPRADRCGGTERTTEAVSQTAAGVCGVIWAQEIAFRVSLLIWDGTRSKCLIIKVILLFWLSYLTNFRFWSFLRISIALLDLTWDFNSSFVSTQVIDCSEMKWKRPQKFTYSITNFNKRNYEK